MRLVGTGRPTVEEMEVTPGTIVAGRYRVDAMLGLGGMAQVYRAWDLELERTIAIKFLSGHSPDSLRRFRREVSLAVRITHENVIRLFDLGSDDGSHFLTMELVEGASLRRHLRNAPLPIADAAEIARQAALGLAAAHEAGVVHRDLKPDNILLSTEGRCVVADFGVAAEDIVSATSASALVGTSSYMAPEQANGDVATARSDLYALGLVLFEMLTGDVPLTGKGPVATALRREKEPAPSVRTLRPDVPEAMDVLLRALLDKDPEHRRATGDEVAAELTPFARPLGPMAAAPPIDPKDFAAHADTHGSGGAARTSSAKRRGPATNPTTPMAEEPPRATSDAPVRDLRPGKWWLWAGLAVMAVVGALMGGVVSRQVPASRLDPTALHVLAVADAASVELPKELEFLRDHSSAALTRALAGKLPGRIGPSGTLVKLQVQPGFHAVMTAGNIRGEGSAPRLSDALDLAAAALVAAAFPSGLGPSSKEVEEAARWRAPDVATARLVHRALVAYARTHFDEAVNLARGARSTGFLRPYMVMAAVLSNFGPLDAAFKKEVEAALSGGPPAEQRLLTEFLASIETTGQPVPSPTRADDAIEWDHRVWTLVYAGRFDEAYAEAEKWGKDPALGGLGLRLAFDLARFYDDERELETAGELARHLPEEVWPWLELGKSRVRAEQLDAAAEAFQRARVLGAADDELCDGEAQLALARFELDQAARLGRRLVTGRTPADRLAGQVALYAVDVLRGDFDTSATRVEPLEHAFFANTSLDSPNDALELGQDALVRGDLPLAARFLTMAEKMAERLHDTEYLASALTKKAAVARLMNTLDDAGFENALAATEKQLREKGVSPTAREYSALSRMLLAVGRRQCDKLRGAPGHRYLQRPAVVLETARCEVESDPARALARLGSMFVGHGRRNYPAVVVESELVLGEALWKLGRRDEARPHLQRVISLWSRTDDKGQVARAQRLLSGK
jgi:tetratricopeptide (TPR) repeat protein